MSQAGEIDIIGTHPEIPIEFVGNTGFAIPIANILNILGINGINVIASGNTVSIDGSGLMSSLIFNGNTGTASPVANNIFFNTQNSTVKMNAASNDVFLNFGLNNLVLGSDPTGTITSATSNCGYGVSCMTQLVGAVRNSAYGSGSMQNLDTGDDNSAFGTGSLANIAGELANCGFGSNSLNLCLSSNNSAFGTASLQSLTSGTANCAFGFQSLADINGDGNTSGGYVSGASLTSGDFNTFWGYQAGINLSTGSYNLFLGENSGFQYTLADSFNISIGSQGLTGESSAIRIGTIGVHDTCYISGIVGITNSNSLAVTIDSTTGQLGTTLIGNPFALSFSTSAGNPVDGEIYYMNNTSTLINTDINLSGTKFFIPVSGTINSCFGSFYTSGTLASNEDVILDILVNGTFAETISSTIELTSTDVNFNNSALGISVTAGDYIQFRMTCPTWTTDPTSTSLSASIFIS